MSIILLAQSRGIASLDVGPVAWALERLMPELCVPTLDGEDREQARVRHAAAADILRELVAEYTAAQAVEGVSA